MAKRKTAKYSILVTVLCLVLCGAMVLGGTYAWFSDSASSGDNIIKSGTLDVELEASDKFGTGYTDAADGSLFSNDILWEPGYTAVKYIKVRNNGSLAFKYNFEFTYEEDEHNTAKLADVIDVYFGKNIEVTSRNDLYKLTPFKKLSEAVIDTNGTLSAGKEEICCIALKMQESAGNEYQNHALNNITVKLIAEQLTSEEDSFGSDYDKNAGLPVAAVYRAPEFENTNITWTSAGGFGPTNASQTLEAAYKFSATENLNAVDDSEYKDWYCDFYVSVNKDIEEGEIFLGGYYDSYGAWVGFENPEDVPANEAIPLLGYAIGSGLSNWTYSDIVGIVGDFICGVADIDNALTDTTFTVQLRLFNPADVDDYKVISEVKYTFRDLAAEFKAEFENNEYISLNGNLDLGNTQVSIPANTNAVLNLNGHTISADFTGTSTYGAFNIPAGSSLTIVGNGEVNVDAAISTGISACIFQNDGILNIHGGSYKITHEGSLSGLGAVVAIIDNCPYSNDSTVNIYDGTFSVEGVGAPNMFRNWPIYSGIATLNIYGGTFNANPDRETTYIWNKNDTNLGAAKAYVNITGGTFNESTGHEFVVEVDGCKEFVSVSVPNVEVVEGSITGFESVPSV